MGWMDTLGNFIANPARRAFVLGGLAAATLPLVGRAAEVCTPYELAQFYRAQVQQRLEVPNDEAILYGSMTEVQLPDSWQGGQPPQYLLAIDKNPHVQAAFLFWRLLPGRYQLVGASPACTGSAPRNETPEGVFERMGRTAPAPSQVHELEFTTQQARLVGGRMRLSEVRLCARAADKASVRWLGSPKSDGCVLLPPTLLAFLERHGVLDAAQPTSALPYPGRFMVVIDSEREDRPAWCGARA